MPLIGAHVDSADPLPAASDVGAEVAQFFLADPQGWKAPVEHAHASAIKNSDLAIYIHAPYVLNVATLNNRIRIPSRKLLGQHAAAAAAIGEFGPGFVLDTCHAHAAGEELDGIVERVRAITGRVDLVHANNSRDAFDSGADRHANMASGQIDPEVIAAIARAAGSDVIVETPREGQADDIEFLRKAIAG